MKKSNITKSIIILCCSLGITTAKAQFVQSAKVVSDNRESRAEFGTSVAINDDFAIVGASRETFVEGAAYIYEKDPQGNSIEALKTPDKRTTYWSPMVQK